MVSLCFVHPNSTLVFCAIYPAFPPKVVTVTEVTVFLKPIPSPFFRRR